MKYERTIQWITIAANFSVLIGIILLLVELGQNQKMMKSQVRNELSNELVDILSLIASNDELASIRRRAEQGDSLNNDEYYRFNHLCFTFFRYWENVHYQYRMGLYDEGEFKFQMDAIMGGGTFTTNSISRDIWCRSQHLFATEFVRDVNERMKILGYACE